MVSFRFVFEFSPPKVWGKRCSPNFSRLHIFFTPPGGSKNHHYRCTSWKICAVEIPLRWRGHGYSYMKGATKGASWQIERLIYIYMYSFFEGNPINLQYRLLQCLGRAQCIYIYIMYLYRTIYIYIYIFIYLLIFVCIYIYVYILIENYGFCSRDPPSMLVFYHRIWSLDPGGSKFTMTWCRGFLGMIAMSWCHF